MRRQLIVAVVCVALASCAKGNDEVETSSPRSTVPQSSSTSQDSIPTTTTSSVPALSTTVASPEPTAESPEALVAGLAGEYHQVRNLDTSTEEMRVLLLYDDATYDFRIEPIGYHESGFVVTDPTTIEFFADGATDPELTFAGRGVANWTIESGDYGPGLVLALQFADGRGYGYDGYDRGVDLYFVAD
jgi:hypothetical protein